MVRVKELMDRVKQNMEHPDWYITDELPWLLRHVSAEGFTVLAEVKSEDSGESENGFPLYICRLHTPVQIRLLLAFLPKRLYALLSG